MFGKQKIATLVAEFLGTAVLTLVALRVVYTLGVPYFVAVAVGLAMVGMVFTFASKAWGYFNPAVTVALMSLRRIGFVDGLMYIVVQVLGAWAAYGAFSFMVSSSTPVLSGRFGWDAFAVQAIATGVFTMALVAAIYQGLSRAVTASFAGIALTVGMLIGLTAAVNPLTGGSLFSGGLLNPAMSFGLRGWQFMSSAGWGVFVLGPVVGALVGANLYHYLLADSVPATAAAAAPARATAKKKPAAKRTAKKK